ncbi:MAG: phosphoglycerate mutase, partial [bacterium]
QRLKGQSPANGLLLRGFDAYPHVPQMQDVTRLNPGAVAVYPDYKGLARIVGMTVYDSAGETVADEIKTLKDKWADHDFFFFHYKKTDSSGEDGDFDRKVSMIEMFDAALPEIMALNPGVIAVTGDHSTPALLKAHSWHPVPLVLSSGCCRRDAVSEFTELACIGGGLGRIPSVSLMPLMLANAHKMQKFGA